MTWLNLLAAHLFVWMTVCALLAVGMIVFLVTWLRRHRVKEDAETAEASTGLVGVAEPYPPAARAADTPGELHLSFLHATQYLRSQTSGRQRLYQAPWFLLLGEAGSGKSTVLRTLGAAGPGAVEGANPRHGVGWRFFDHGVVLDVPGDYLIRPDTLNAQERSWRGLLRLLNRYRPRRPLDGVVLVLPALDFASTSDLDQTELIRKAARIADKLAQLQRESGVCFPVYVLISKCDQVEGFQNYCQALPPGHRREMFGWSSPYRAEAAFESAWVDEAFDQVVEALNRSQSELFAERLEALDPASVFFFPDQMFRMRDRLRVFLHQIFRTTAYRESFSCRGLYFCGEALPESDGAATGRQLATRGYPERGETDRRPTDSRETDRLETNFGPGAGLLGLQLPAAPADAYPVFIDDLFERKIFPEWGLAFPERQVFAFRRGAMLTARTVTLAAAAILALGLGWGYYRLHRIQQNDLPVLQRIQDDLGAANGAAQPERNANALVRDVAVLGQDRIFSVFIPASWSRSLDDRIEDAIRVAFERSVLQVALNELVQKAQALGTAPPPPPIGNGKADDGGAGASASDPAEGDTPAPLPGAALNPEQLPAYIALAQFTDQVEELERNIARYAHISIPGVRGDVDDLNALIQYLHPANAYQVAPGGETYFTRALDAATGPPFPQAVLDSTRGRVVAEMTDRVDALYAAWFQNSPSLAQLQDLTAKIDALRNSSRFGYAQLTDLRDSLEQAQVLVNDPHSAWMANENAVLAGPLRRITLDPVESSDGQPYNLFYPPADLKNYIQQNAQADWQQLHDDLGSQETLLTGPLLQFGDNSVRLSPGVEGLRLPIADLMDLSFMAGNPVGALRASPPAGGHLKWDPVPLQEAVDMVAAYQRYLNEGLLEAPAGVRETFRKIAIAHLTANMVDQIGQAEVWTPEAPGADATAAAANESKSFQTAQPLLSELMQDFAQLGQDAVRQQLLTLAHSHAYGLLQGLDRELQSTAPYTPHGNLASWDGSLPPSLATFGLRAPQDLAGYLEFERQQTEALAASAAPMVDFLRQTPTAGRSIEEAQLTARWQALIAAVKQYDNRIPGNSLSTLEDYIATGMDKTTPATHCGAPPAAEAGEAAADYFLATRAQLRGAVYQRCRVLDAETARRDYATLADLFNRTLAGKFPFAPAARAGTIEADPAAIADFYLHFDALQPSFGDNVDAPAAAAFLQQMQALRPLFSSYLGSTAHETGPVLDLTPTFRVNQARERGGNEIIGWSLKVGTQKAQSGQPAQTLRWALGTPIALTLQWASDSPHVPVRHSGGAQGAPGTPRVDDRTVTFEYSDPWSLFALLESQRAAAADFADLTDTAPVTLALSVPIAAASAPGFPVPTVATDQTKVFVRIAILIPGKVESQLTPDFPQQAPPWQ